jgi:hypothetical protein
VRHPGLLRFTEEEGTPGDPVAAIRRRTRAAAAAAMSQGWSGPPWNMELLASLQGIRVENAGHLGRERDALWTSGRILVSHSAPPTRRRYSIAHEIVHSFLAPHDEGTDLRVLPPADRQAADGELEYLCQVGAAELLMPSESYAVRMGPGMPSVALVLQLARDFQVSPEAAARRAVDLAAERCAALCARPWDGGESPLVTAGRRRGAAPRVNPKPDDLVVTGYHPSANFAPVRVAIGEPIPRSFHAHRAFSLALARPAKDHFRRNVAGWPAYPELGAVDMEAVPLPFRKKPIEILAVLRPAANA